MIKESRGEIGPVQKCRGEREGDSRKSKPQVARKPGQGVFQSQDRDVGTAGENGTPAVGGSVSIQTSYPKPELGAGLGSARPHWRKKWTDTSQLWLP